MKFIIIKDNYDMNNTKAYLIYCIDNQNIANHITDDLGRVGIDFIHDTFDFATHDAIRQQYSNSTAPVFLLVSDNFLKSENCMRNILELVEDTRLRGRIKTIILEGRHPIKGTDQYKTIATKFERLGDVVNYINYWSMQYQQIRTEMRHTTEARRTELAPKLDLIQDISTNILGDFMRYLRGTNYVLYQRLKDDNFRELFEEFGGDSALLMRKYGMLPAYSPAVKEVEEEKDVVVDESEQDIREEEIETTTEVLDDVSENVEEGFDLSAIPGLNLLSNREETPEDDESDSKTSENDLSTISDEMLDDLADDLISEEEEDFIEDEMINETFEEINDKVESDDTSPDALADLIDELADDLVEDTNEEVVEDGDEVEGEHSVDALETEEVEGESVEDLENTIVEETEVKGTEDEDNEVNAADENEKVFINMSDFLEEVAAELEESESEKNADGLLDEVKNEKELLNVSDFLEKVAAKSRKSESEKNADGLLDDVSEDLVNEMDVNEAVNGESKGDETLMDDVVEKEVEAEIKQETEETEDLIDELIEDSEVEDEVIVQPSTDIAEELAASGDIEGATGLYRQLVENTPENVDLRYAFAMMLIENGGDRTLAKENLVVASQLDEDDEDILFALGVLSESEGNFEDAKRYYEKVILLDLEHEQAYYRLGSLLANAYENQQFVASSYLQRAISLDDEYAEAYFEYAKLLNTYFGKSKKSAKYFKKAVKNNRHFAEAHFELAKIYNKIDKKSKALRHYENAIEINNRFQTAENDALFGLQVKSPEGDSALGSGEQNAKDSEPKGTILITGATSGIGRATAELFARNGYNLIITGRREERLMALKDILEAEFSTQILTLTFDVRNQAAVEAAIASLEGDWKNIDVLVNNAGLAKGFTPINEGQLTHWETMIDTNLKGLLYVTRAVSPLMVENSKGFIINIGSIAGKETYTNGNVYCATKAAVDALTKGMRLDLHHHNIRVTGIHPGHVETEFAVVRFDGDEERAKIYDDFQPLKAADVADTIYYVATRPAHVNIEDIVMWSTQQASATIIDKSGREKFAEK